MTREARLFFRLQDWRYDGECGYDPAPRRCELCGHAHVHYYFVLHHRDGSTLRVGRYCLQRVSRSGPLVRAGAPLAAGERPASAASPACEGAAWVSAAALEADARRLRECQRERRLLHLAARSSRWLAERLVPLDASLCHGRALSPAMMQVVNAVLMGARARNLS